MRGFPFSDSGSPFGCILFLRSQKLFPIKEAGFCIFCDFNLHFH